MTKKFLRLLFSVSLLVQLLSSRSIFLGAFLSLSFIEEVHSFQPMWADSLPIKQNISEKGESNIDQVEVFFNAGQPHSTFLAPNVLFTYTLKPETTGVAQLQVCKTSGSLPTNYSVDEIPDATWLDVAPRTGTVTTIGQCNKHAVTFNSKGLNGKVVESSIRVSGNFNNSPSIYNIRFTVWLEADLKLRLFIPCSAVNSPFGDLFGGDSRSFAYSGGQSRFEEHLLVSVDPQTDNPIIKRLSSRYWEPTRSYASSNDAGQQSNTGNQDWCRQLAANASTPEIRPANIGGNDRPAFAGRLQSGEGVATRFVLEGGNPFYLGVAPKVDGDIAVFLRQNEGSEPEYRIYGKHDGFPAYEIYIDQKLVYCHDPIRSGNSPLSLYGGLGFGGVTADTQDWKKIQEINCSTIKGVQTNSATGDKGSKFTVTGNGFVLPNLSIADHLEAVQSNVIISINNTYLGSVNPDIDGRFQFILDTAQASYGIYEVIALDEASGKSYRAKFQVQTNSFIVEKLPGVEKTFLVPPDIPKSEIAIYLPVIRR